LEKIRFSEISHFLWRLLNKKYQPWMLPWLRARVMGFVKRDKRLRIIYILSLVNFFWYYRLKINNKFSKKIKVGFGPILTGEGQIDVRQARIDPIVNWINKNSHKFSADIFFEPKEMRGFDISVVVKEFNGEYYQIIKSQKKKRKYFVFDVVDNPCCSDVNSYRYDQHPEFINLMDAVIASSPLHLDDLSVLDPIAKMIEHPILNSKYSRYKNKKNVDIVWQGFIGNAKMMKEVNIAINDIRRKSSKKIRLICNTNCRKNMIKDGIIYINWHISNWQKILANSDIGISVKPLDNYFQQRKPSNKIVSYMAAGLPVVCTPSAADKLVIEHGRTGYFAYTIDEWSKYLFFLIENPGERKKIGLAARRFVAKNFNISKIAEKYINLFENILENNINNSYKQ
jgi:glycosyltransferase involved in cell wall biosynthesis